MKKSPMIIDMTVPESAENITDRIWSDHINSCSNSLFRINLGSLFQCKKHFTYYYADSPKYFDDKGEQMRPDSEKLCMLLSYSLIQDVYRPGNEFRFIMDQTNICKDVFKLHTLKSFKDWQKMDLKLHNCVLYKFMCDEQIYYSYAHPKVNMTKLQDDMAISLRVHFMEIDLIKQEKKSKNMLVNEV